MEDPKKKLNGIFNILNKAIKKYPSLKHAWLLVGVFVLMWLIKYFEIGDVIIPWKPILIVIGLLFVASIFTFVTRHNDKRIRPALIGVSYVIYVTVVLFIIGAIYFGITGKPKFYEKVFGFSLIEPCDTKIEPAFSKVDSSYKILILPFSQYRQSEKNKMVDAGKILSDRLRALNIDDLLNIKVKYLEDFKQCVNFEERSFRQANNANLIIFGWQENDCNGTKVCYKYDSDSISYFMNAKSGFNFGRTQSSSAGDFYDGEGQEDIDYLLYFHAGKIEFERGHFSNAIYYHKKAEQNKVTGPVLTYLACSYQNSNDTGLAIQYHIRALKEFETTEPIDFLNLAVQNCNLGVIYASVDSSENAKKFLLKGVSLLETYDKYDRFNLAESYLNLGSVYGKDTICDSAIFYFGKAKYLLEAMNSTIEKSVFATFYSNLGVTYANCNYWDSALKYHLITLSTQKQYIQDTNSYEFIITYNNIAKTYQRLNDTSNAITFIEKAWELTFHPGNEILRKVINERREHLYKHFNMKSPK